MKNQFLTFLTLVLIAFSFASCEGDDLEEITLEIEEEETILVDCENMYLSIVDLGFEGLLVEVYGGTAPFEILWSTGETTEELFDILFGDYSVTVTDSEGCTVTAEYTIEAPDPCLSLSLNVTGENFGMLTASANGGTSPYSYEWSTGDTGANLEVPEDGSYTVSVTDSEGCTMSETVEAIVNPCAGFESSYVFINENDETLEVVVVGGAAPYTFNWSTGENTQSIAQPGSGVYTVLMTDANGCEAVIEIAIP